MRLRCLVLHSCIYTVMFICFIYFFSFLSSVAICLPVVVAFDIPAGKKKQYHVCRELEYRRDHMQIETPIINSQVNDWDAVERKE